MVEFFTVDNKQVAVTSKKLVRLEGCRTPKCEEMVGKEGWGSLCSTLLNQFTKLRVLGMGGREKKCRPKAFHLSQKERGK
jgi:hypothetical protein